MVFVHLIHELSLDRGDRSDGPSSSASGSQRHDRTNAPIVAPALVARAVSSVETWWNRSRIRSAERSADV